MIKALVSDFSRVLLFPRDKNYQGGLNVLHRELSLKTPYVMLDHFELNQELLDFYKSIRDKMNIYIFTSETIQDSSEIQPIITSIFKDILSALKMGVHKRDPEAYLVLADHLKVLPEEILYIDDSVSNLEVARKVGMQTIQYSDNARLFLDLESAMAR